MSKEFNFLREQLEKKPPLQPNLDAVLSTLRDLILTKELALNPDRELLTNISNFVKKNEHTVCQQLLRPQYYTPFLDKQRDHEKLKTLVAVLAYNNPDFSKNMLQALERPSRLLKFCDIPCWRAVLDAPDKSAVQDSFAKKCLRKLLPAIPSLSTLTQHGFANVRGRFNDQGGERSLIRALATQVCQEARQDRAKLSQVVRFLFGARGGSSFVIAVFSWLVSVLPRIAAAIFVVPRMPSKLFRELPKVIANPPEESVRLASPMAS